MINRAIFISLGFVMGNFLVQMFGEHHWGIALERSFFQVFAIWSFVLLCNNKFVGIQK
jgi:hypothetical protein